MAGEEWLRLFMHRWPELRRHKAQHINPNRAQKLNRFIVRDHFSKLKETLENMELFDHPQKICNLDEKCCRLAIHHQQGVITKKGQKQVYHVAPKYAAERRISLMIIFKSKNCRENFGDSFPPLACFEMAEKGGMTHGIFLKWFYHFAKFKFPGKVLFIFDGAKCHLSPDIVNEADNHEVTLFCLSSNTIHELQPLDVAVFRAFEHYKDEEFLKFWRRRPNRTLSKELFGETFTPVWNKTITLSDIQSGFRKCGIYPFDAALFQIMLLLPAMQHKLQLVMKDKKKSLRSCHHRLKRCLICKKHQLAKTTMQLSTSQDASSKPFTIHKMSGFGRGWVPYLHHKNSI